MEAEVTSTSLLLVSLPHLVPCYLQVHSVGRFDSCSLHLARPENGSKVLWAVNVAAQMEWEVAVLLQLSALVAQSTARHMSSGEAGWQLECSYQDVDSLVLLASTIHNMRPRRTVLSDHNSRCLPVATRERLHPDLISWLESNAKFSCFLTVVIVLLNNFSLI